jgi:hypothetical protein
MAILLTGADIRPDGCGRGCHFLPAGQTYTHHVDRQVWMRVLFFT